METNHSKDNSSNQGSPPPLDGGEGLQRSQSRLEPASPRYRLDLADLFEPHAEDSGGEDIDIQSYHSNPNEAAQKREDQMISTSEPPQMRQLAPVEVKNSDKGPTVAELKQILDQKPQGKDLEGHDLEAFSRHILAQKAILAKRSEMLQESYRNQLMESNANNSTVIHDYERAQGLALGGQENTRNEQSLAKNTKQQTDELIQECFYAEGPEVAKGSKPQPQSPKQRPQDDFKIFKTQLEMSQFQAKMSLPENSRIAINQRIEPKVTENACKKPNSPVTKRQSIEPGMAFDENDPLDPQYKKRDETQQNLIQDQSALSFEAPESEAGDSSAREDRNNGQNRIQPVSFDFQSEKEHVEGPTELSLDMIGMASEGQAKPLNRKLGALMTSGIQQIIGRYKSRRDESYEDGESEDDADDAGGKAKIEITPEEQEANVQPNYRFRQYIHLFKNLLKATGVKLQYPICSLIISFDQSRIIVVAKNDDREYWIQMYCLQTYQLKMEEKVGGQPADFIKIKEVVQSKKGNHFAAVYFNDGIFKLRIFGRITRSKAEIESSEININDLLGLDNWTMANEGFNDPYITCCFINDDQMFISLFHNFKLTHFHFILSIKSGKIVGRVSSREMDCSKKNFPFQCFYSNIMNEFYVFYRQGQSFIVNRDNVFDYEFDRMSDLDLGQMFLVNQKALIVRSSGSIFFFKLEAHALEKKRQWKQYHFLNHKGFLYHSTTNKDKSIQIVTDEQIFFYGLCEDTLMPVLQNVIYNFMGCNQIILRPQANFCIAYKLNQNAFTVYDPALKQHFIIPVVEDNFEGSKGLELRTMNTFLCSQLHQLIIYDSLTFAQVGNFGVPKITLFESEAREPNEILAVQACQNEEWIAVMIGKNLIKGEQQANYLVIYRRKGGKIHKKTDKFEQEALVMLKDVPEFQKVSLKFHFKIEEGIERDSIIFLKKDKILTLNFRTNQLKTLIPFRTPMTSQPAVFLPSEKQESYIAASDVESYLFYKNEEQKFVQLSLDQTKEYSVSQIKAVVYDPEIEHFYILCNKHKNVVGLFVLKVSKSKPRHIKKQFLIKHKTSMEIGDANMYILRNESKELIISYKTIEENTYTILSMEIIVQDGTNIIYMHQSFQAGESGVWGMLTSKNSDFIKISRDGINVVALGSQPKKMIKDGQGNKRILHSLQSMDYLKLDSNSCLFFDCTNLQKQEIRIMHEYVKKPYNSQNSAFSDTTAWETKFDTIFKIKMCSMKLREMLIFKSLYYSSTLSDIAEQVRNQQQNECFYKSFMEFDGQNFVSILSFDNRSIQYLLSDRFSENFSVEYPVFYKNKIQIGSKKKFLYRNAIENALRRHQVSSVNSIIEFIAKYQNNFYSSFLFNKIFVQLFEKGINVEPLLQNKCNIFCFEFSFEEWPEHHTNKENYLRAYNGSVYTLREHYRTVFPEDEFLEMESHNGRKDTHITSDKIFKITYQINLLPCIGMHVQYQNDGKQENKIITNRTVEFIERFKLIDDAYLGMFNCQSLQYLIEFKWQEFAKGFHLIAFVMHLISCGILLEYVYLVYLQNITYDFEKKRFFHQNLLSPTLLIGILYPLAFQLESVRKHLFNINRNISKYFKNPANYADWFYILGSIVMCRMHYNYSAFDYYSKTTMNFIIMLLTFRTGNFLGIFDTFSPIVIMLFKVIRDLVPFLVVYILLVIGLSCIFGVLECGNLKNEDGRFYTTFEDKLKLAPGAEYQRLRLRQFGNIFDTIRTSLGDFAIIGSSIYLDSIENHIFWIAEIVIIIITLVVFLNFIIAETTASYKKVNQFIDAYRAQKRASLIAEAEYTMPECAMTSHRFPKYIVIREVEI